MKKNRREAVFLRVKKNSLEFDFLVLDMLACLGVELHDRHFFGHGFFVFAGRVEVTCAGS